MDRQGLSLAIELALSQKGIKTTRKQVEHVLVAMSEVIFNELSKGNEVRIHKFANFGVTQRGPRRGVNPITMDTVMIPAHKTVKVTMSQVIKKRINGK